ncbi:MAG: hypothetical protein P0S93_02405 [Candidatus Neptunochlamydia sp.]|nr:hypothetical protein [Candidatus Neptunochlamydia sp.]
MNHELIAVSNIHLFPLGWNMGMGKGTSDVKRMRLSNKKLDMS